jgi:hypothetical protein
MRDLEARPYHHGMNNRVSAVHSRRAGSPHSAISKMPRDRHAIPMGTPPDAVRARRRARAVRS